MAPLMFARKREGAALRLPLAGIAAPPHQQSSEAYRLILDPGEEDRVGHLAAVRDVQEGLMPTIRDPGI